MSRFEFHPERIQIGTLYRYTKSNRDGSQAITIDIYIAAQDRLEVVKYEPHHGAAAYVLAQIDWEVFSAHGLESWVILSDGTRRQAAIGSLLKEDDLFMVSINTPTGTLNDAVVVEHYPVHMYNFDFISLNFTFPHLIDPEGEFEIGVLQPTFGEVKSRLIAYKGTALIQFETADDHSRFYRISGAGLDGHTGTIQVSKSGGHIENIEIPIPDNPEWHDFKFTLNTIIPNVDWLQHMERELKQL